MEELALEPEAPARLAAVGRVAHERMADRGEMCPDLVGAPGLEPRLDQRGPRERLDADEVRARGARTVGSRRDDGSPFAVAPEGRVDRAGPSRRLDRGRGRGTRAASAAAGSGPAAPCAPRPTSRRRAARRSPGRGGAPHPGARPRPRPPPGPPAPGPGCRPCGRPPDGPPPPPACRPRSGDRPRTPRGTARRHPPRASGSGRLERTRVGDHVLSRTEAMALRPRRARPRSPRPPSMIRCAAAREPTSGTAARATSSRSPACSGPATRSIRATLRQSQRPPAAGDGDRRGVGPRPRRRGRLRRRPRRCRPR